MTMSGSDELDEHLRGDSALTRAYQREPAPMPPHAVDRAVLCASRVGLRKSQYLAPSAFAASVLLSFAMVLAIVFAPRPAREQAPKLVHVGLYSDSGAVRKPAQWLADIATLRRAGRYGEASAEMRRFRVAYPNYIIPSEE
jgi:hypothetical protein